VHPIEDDNVRKTLQSIQRLRQALIDDNLGDNLLQVETLVSRLLEGATDGANGDEGHVHVKILLSKSQRLKSAFKDVVS